MTRARVRVVPVVDVVEVKEGTKGKRGFKEERWTAGQTAKSGGGRGGQIVYVALLYCSWGVNKNKEVCTALTRSFGHKAPCMGTFLITRSPLG